MTFREIVFGTDDYRRECVLRDAVLRKPLGLSLYDENLAAEKDHLHVGIFEPDGELAACAVAVPLSATEAKIRQVAVDPAQQGKGLGRIVMNEIEKILQARGLTGFVLSARTSALGFYEKLGYSSVGDEFLQHRIPHFKMVKTVHMIGAVSNQDRNLGGTG